MNEETAAWLKKHGGMKHKGSSQICMHNVHGSIYIEVTLANDLIKEALKSSKST